MDVGICTPPPQLKRQALQLAPATLIFPVTEAQMEIHAIHYLTRSDSKASVQLLQFMSIFQVLLKLGCFLP